VLGLPQLAGGSRTQSFRFLAVEPDNPSTVLVASGSIFGGMGIVPVVERDGVPALNGRESRLWQWRTNSMKVVR
jgi:hypothetical protein